MAGRRHTRPRCGAKTRRGTPCRCSALPGKRRCKYHGGMSTGPKSEAGRLQSAKNLEAARRALAAPEHAATRSEAAKRGHITRKLDNMRLQLERLAREGDPLALRILSRM